MPTEPFTRSLGYVLRDALDRPEVILLACKVTAVPSSKRVTIELGGTTTTVPKLASYAAVINDTAQVLAIGSVMLALGTVK